MHRIYYYAAVVFFMRFAKLITYNFERVSARIMFMGIKLKSIVLTITAET